MLAAQHQNCVPLLHCMRCPPPHQTPRPAAQPQLHQLRVAPTQPVASNQSRGSLPPHQRRCPLTHCGAAHPATKPRAEAPLQHQRAQGQSLQQQEIKPLHNAVTCTTATTCAAAVQMHVTCCNIGRVPPCAHICAQQAVVDQTHCQPHHRPACMQILEQLSLCVATAHPMFGTFVTHTASSMA